VLLATGDVQEKTRLAMQGYTQGEPSFVLSNDNSAFSEAGRDWAGGENLSVADFEVIPVAGLPVEEEQAANSVTQSYLRLRNVKEKSFFSICVNFKKDML
jgi:hypothetical protein